jgi:hypothetical protein
VDVTPEIPAFMATALPFELLVTIFTDSVFSKIPVFSENWYILPDVSRSINHPALSAYSLVHSTWSSPARYLLFRHSVVSSPAHWESLLSPASHFQSFVRTLELRIAITIDQSLERILPRLLPSVEHVIFGAKFKPCLELLHILPTINRVHVHSTKESERLYVFDEVHRADTELALHDLRIDEMGAQDGLLQWIEHTRTSELSTLRTVKLFAWTHQFSTRDGIRVVYRESTGQHYAVVSSVDYGHQLVRKLLEMNGRVQHLTLTLNIDREWTDNPEPAALHLNTCSACSLVLVVPFHPSRHSCPWVFATLRDTTFPRLRHLIIHFEDEERPWVVPDSWMTIDQLYDREARLEDEQWKLDSRGIDPMEMELEGQSDVGRMRSYAIPPPLISRLERVVIRCAKEYHETKTMKTMVRLLGDGHQMGVVEITK